MKLPDHLSPEAAMALYDFVSDLQDTIWDKYEHLLIPLCIAEQHQPPLTDDDFDHLDDFDDQLSLF